jgi:hypothetical protein
MRQRYRLYKRKNGGRYYIHDEVTGKQDSLHTSDRATAVRLFHSRQEAEQQPAVNLQIARAYLAASDPQIATRNWQFVMDELVKLKKDQTQHRWQTAIRDKAFDSIRHQPLLETRPEHFLRVLEAGKVSTNVYLRRIQNFALDMTWLPWPVLARLATVGSEAAGTTCFHRDDEETAARWFLRLRALMRSEGQAG